MPAFAHGAAITVDGRSFRIDRVDEEFPSSFGSVLHARAAVKRAHSVVSYNGVTAYGAIDQAYELHPMGDGGAAQVRVTTLDVVTADFDATADTGNVMTRLWLARAP